MQQTGSPKQGRLRALGGLELQYGRPCCSHQGDGEDALLSNYTVMVGASETSWSESPRLVGHSE